MSEEEIRLTDHYYTESEINNKVTDLNNKINTKAPINHKSNSNTYGVGDASNYGHVKLSDATDSNLSTNDGVAITPKAINNLNNDFETFKSTFLNLVYPVGSIYMSMNATNPHNLFGGTWERLEDTFLLASGNTYTADSSDEKTAQHGSANAAVVKHTHTQNGHTHIQNAHNHHANALMSSYNRNIEVSARRVSLAQMEALSDQGETHLVYVDQPNYVSGQTGIGEEIWTDLTTATNNETIAINQETGVDGTGKNMPPYLAVYMWKRIE